MYDKGGPANANPASFGASASQLASSVGNVTVATTSRGVPSRSSSFGQPFGGVHPALHAMDANDVAGEGAKAERRFLSVSNGGLFMAAYYTLQSDGGFVECSASKRSTSSEKLCDLARCCVEIQESNLSLCGFVLRISKAVDQSEAFILRPSRLAEFMEWASVVQQAVDKVTVERELRGTGSQRVARRAAEVLANGGRNDYGGRSVANGYGVGAAAGGGGGGGASAAAPGENRNNRNNNSSPAVAAAMLNPATAAAVQARRARAEEAEAEERRRREERGRLFRMPGDERKDADLEVGGWVGGWVGEESILALVDLLIS